MSFKYTNLNGFTTEINLFGRDKCDILRKMRKMIADANGIGFEPAVCHHEGPCIGTCPTCDNEIKYLDGVLQKMKERGEKITLYNLGLHALDQAKKSIITPDDGIYYDKYDYRNDIEIVDRYIDIDEFDIGVDITGGDGLIDLDDICDTDIKEMD